MTRTVPIRHGCAFKTRYEARYHEKPDHFAALAYDQMQILLQVDLRGWTEPRHDS